MTRDTTEELPALSDSEATALLCRSFSEHWKATVARQAGGEDVAAEEAPCFLGGSPGARLRHARRFYSRAHCELMAALTEEETPAQLGALLPRLLECASDPLVSRRRVEQERLLREVLTSEYVAFVRRAGRGRSWVAYRYPGGGYYDDLYEWLAGGLSIGGRLELFKSTGEPFTPLERRSAMAGIRRDIIGQARVEDAETDWRLEFDDLSPPDRVECDVWFELESEADDE